VGLARDRRIRGREVPRQEALAAGREGTGAIVWRDQPAVRSDVQRIVAMWTELLEQSKGPMLFGEFSIADAYFAPVCFRIKNYSLPVPGHITDYVRRVCALSGVKAWVEDALAEKDFVDFDEPYRTSR
jgi:glutathione S-transferase